MTNVFAITWAEHYHVSPWAVLPVAGTQQCQLREQKVLLFLEELVWKLKTLLGIITEF